MFGPGIGGTRKLGPPYSPVARRHTTIYDDFLMGTIIILTVVAVLLGLTVVVGFAAALGRQHISEDYFVAGRSLPWYVVAFSVAGLSLRLEMWLGLLGLTYLTGVAAGGLAWSSFIGLTVLSGVFLPYLVRKKISSPAEFLQRRYSPATRGLFALLSILFLVLGVLVPALYVGGWVLCEAGFNVPLTSHNGMPWIFFSCVAAIALFSSLAGVGRRFAGRGLGRRGAIPGQRHRWNGLCRRGDPPCRRAGQTLGKNGPARTSLLLSSHHDLLPWIGMVSLALTIGVWNSAVSPLVVQRCLGARSEWDALWARSWAACCCCSCRQCLSCRAWAWRQC